MSKPHIVYIITKLELGGAQKVCLSLFEGIAHDGFSSSLISGTHGSLVQQVATNPHAYLLSSLTRDVKTGTIINELRCMKDLITQLRALKKKYPDLIVHTHSTKAGLMGRWAAFFAGVRTRVHTVHGYGFHPYQSKLIWLITYLLELMTSFITTHFICVSSADVQTGIRLFPRFAKKYSLIRAAVSSNPLPLKLPSSLSASPDTTEASEQRETRRRNTSLVIGTVACFKPQKNLFDLMHAFARVHEHDQRTRLEIIGDGILRPALEAWIDTHGLSTVITLHGWQDDVFSIMRTWHIFALTSLWEGLPCAIIEARLLKLPIVSYDTGGIRDVIHHGKNGFLYPHHAWHSLADGILSILRNPPLYTRMQHYPDALDEFSNPNMIHNHQKLYQSLHAR